ncbi:DUF488 family protein [Marinifilum sp. D714]|uniref:DUF488 domain-containing protein n=1 Tax=Marinifilum sp. D714 TaxID=2937523 RepID=UPI0027C92F96|nr:DUF488 domain-containing protein [Marinifilum sp. D714]MDQ2179309.1 DUF488 domain-containing protein [Marinifilum sp. D714]
MLSLIQLLNNEVDKLRFQKLLFLYCKKKSNSEYDFIPYKFGCYSYSANADLTALAKKNIISETDNSYRIVDKVDYLELLKPKDKNLLKEVVNIYGKMSANSLIVHTYINYPFYAIKSTIAQKVLNEKLYKRVIDVIPNNDTETLFTIGYEGISLEKYLSRLVKNNIKVLVDVRRNPLSMKYGFSKTLLSRYCESLDIIYVHIPDVGIDSNKRQELNTQKDYDELFEDYNLNNLTRNINSRKEILQILTKNKRIALTCFEANIHQCHRLHLAESLRELHPDIRIEHI